MCRPVCSSAVLAHPIKGIMDAVEYINVDIQR